MVLKKVHIVGGLALAGFGFGTYKYCQIRNDRANAERYKKISFLVGRTNLPKTKWITLWQFPLGPVEVSTSRTISGRSPFRESDLPELYKHLSNRHDYLHRLKGNYYECEASLSWNLEGKTKRNVYVSMVGVEVIPLQTGLKPKYKVIDMFIGAGFITAEPGQPLLLPKQTEKVTRDDFVNPEDIDWMFDVKDFSKINAFTTIIP